MTRRISIRSYRKPDTLYSPLDLVVCEGETEVDYLCELARSLRIHVHICKGDGTDPKSIVNTAKRKSKEDGVKYDRVFCVFDRDNDLSSFLEAIELCKTRKFIAIVSNPCFELWPYLHFQIRESGFGGPQQMLRALNSCQDLKITTKMACKSLTLPFISLIWPASVLPFWPPNNMMTLKKILLRIFTYSSKDFRFLKRNKTILDKAGHRNED